MNPVASQSIRRATAEDVGVLARLMGEFYAESGYPLRETRVHLMFSEVLSDERLGLIWLLLAEDESPVGYVAVTLAYSLEYGGTTAFLDDLFVKEAYRGRGLGTLALGVVEREVIARGVHALHLEVGHDNERARQLYDRVGFRNHNRRLLTKTLKPALHDAHDS